MGNWPLFIKQHKVLTVSILVLSAMLFIAAWFHITNPYASLTIVRQPYKTEIVDGSIKLKKQFSIQTYSSDPAQKIGYIKSGFLIVQNSWFGSYKAPSEQTDDIIRDIHNLRFDPRKPYLISGDQFSVLYPRNLGVFYNSILNPATALDQKDWQNRQRIYLQSAAYALDAFATEKTLTTTIVPIGSQKTVLTEVHPGSVPSDSLYGMLFALRALQDEQRYPSSPTYHLQTKEAAKQLVIERRADLDMLLGIYLSQVRNPSTGLVRHDIHLAGARDGAVRESSFYDNVILWKTMQLARELKIRDIPQDELTLLRQKILLTYWDDSEGHFKDDLSSRGPHENYSSDWLIALPTKFLTLDNSNDINCLKRSIAFIRSQGITKPLPIKYTASNKTVNAPWVVRTFVPNYGGDAIWGYWGAQYMTLLGDLSKVTEGEHYREEALAHIATYRQKIKENRGYPETFDSRGELLENAIYKSIRQTGWVVQFEEAMKSVQYSVTTAHSPSQSPPSGGIR